MRELLPTIFSLLVSASVAAAFISMLMCGVLDGLARMIRPRDARQLQATEQGDARL